MNTTLNKDDESEFSIFYNLYKKDENDTRASSSSLFGLNEDGEMLFRFVVQGVGISLVSIFGIIGNILSIIVLAKKKMRSPISCYLRGLAVADMVFAALATLVVGIPSFAAYVTDMGDFGINTVTKSKIVFMTPVFYGLAVTSLGASVLFTLAVTIERYIAVCHPFKARSWLTYKSAVYSSFGIGVFAIIFNAPRWFEYEILEVYDPETKELTGYRPIPSQFRMNPIYDTYVYVSYTIIMIAMPVVMLIVLNILIYRAVRRANRHRRRLTSSQLHENRLAMMFLVIVSFFIVFNAIQIFEIIYRKFAGVKNESVTEIECIRNFFAVFNSSINFVIYCFLGGKFQEVFLELWPPWIRNNLCCVCPNRDKRMSWNRTVFMASKNEARKFPSFLSLSSASTKTLDEDISLSSVYISHI